MATVLNGSSDVVLLQATVLRKMLDITTDILQSVVLVHLCLLAEQQGEVAPSLPHAGAAAGSGGTTVGPAHTGQGVSGRPREEGIRGEERGGEVRGREGRGGEERGGEGRRGGRGGEGRRGKGRGGEGGEGKGREGREVCMVGVGRS